MWPLRKIFETKHDSHDQFFSWNKDGIKYSVSALYAHAEKEIKPTFELTESLADDLKETTCDEPIGSPEFVARANRTDVDSIIMAVRDASDKLHIVDGAHRVWKRNYEQLEWTMAYVFDQKLPDSCIVSK